MATSDSNGQRGRYPLFTSFYPFHTWEIYIETRFQTGCCLHAFILYHIISLIALNYGNLLASWIFHGIPMFPSQVVLSPRIRWLSWQVTRNPRPRQQAWEHLGKSGLVFFLRKMRISGTCSSVLTWDFQRFFFSFLGQSEAQHIFSSVLTWNFPMCRKKWWSSKFSQAMLELGHWGKLPSSTARGEEGRAKGC